MRANGHRTISPVGTVIMYVGNIANIAVGRLHAYKAGNRHLLAAELLVIG